MKKLESTLGNMVMVLTGITIIAAVLLAVMNEVTKEPIAAIEKANLEAGILKVLPGADAISNLEKPEVLKQNIDGKEKDLLVYTAVKDGKEIGKAVKVAVQGFSPDLTVLVGFDSEGNILGYEVLKHGETPGLGAQASEWFKDQANNPKSYIIGMNPGKNNMTVSKDGGEVDAITASTITSRAFLKAVNAEYNALFKANVSTGATQKAAPADEKPSCCGDSVPACCKADTAKVNE